jgi:hypothetical protein
VRAFAKTFEPPYDEAIVKLVSDLSENASNYIDKPGKRNPGSIGFQCKK